MNFWFHGEDDIYYMITKDGSVVGWSRATPNWGVTKGILEFDPRLRGGI